MHFVVFFPGSHPCSPDLLKKHGLGDFVDGYSAMNAKSGPNQVPGMLYHWELRPHYDHETTEWIDCGAYHLGFATTASCSPSELARREQFDGVAVRLGDGHEWIVPRAVRLPRDMQFTGGKWTRRVKARFAKFWQDSEQWFKWFSDAITGDGVLKIESELSTEEFDAKWMSYLVDALRINYRVTPEIVSKLGLFDTTNRVEATIATISGMEIKEALEDLEKKDDLKTLNGS
jgi:hypothetical protein